MVSWLLWIATVIEHLLEKYLFGSLFQLTFYLLLSIHSPGFHGFLDKVFDFMWYFVHLEAVYYLTYRNHIVCLFVVIIVCLFICYSSLSIFCFSIFLHQHLKEEFLCRTYTLYIQYLFTDQILLCNLSDSSQKCILKYFIIISEIIHFNPTFLYYCYYTNKAICFKNILLS